MQSTAATNLSFMYFLVSRDAIIKHVYDVMLPLWMYVPSTLNVSWNILQQGEQSQAEKYAELAISVDRYNPLGSC